jgi:hypothetical protein
MSTTNEDGDGVEAVGSTTEKSREQAKGQSAQKDEAASRVNSVGSSAVPPVLSPGSDTPVSGAVFEIDPAMETRVRRKLDRVVVPLVFSLYLAAFLDRSNIGNANIANMSLDLGLNDAQYQVSVPSSAHAW